MKLWWLLLLWPVVAVAQNESCPHQPYEYAWVSTPTNWFGSGEAAGAAAYDGCVATWNAGGGCLSHSGSSSFTYQTGATCTESNPLSWACTAPRIRKSDGVQFDFPRGVSMTRRDTVTCPEPDQCDPSFAGEKAAFGSSVAIGGLLCDSTSNCILQRKQATGSQGQYAAVFENTGQTCSGEDEAPPYDEAEECVGVGDGTYCASPNAGDGSCGYFNDSFLYT